MSSPPELSAAAIREFKRIFADAQAEIVFILSKYRLLDVPGYELGRQKVILKQVEEILDGLDEPVTRWSERWLPDAYEKGTLYTTSQLAEMGLAESGVKIGFGVVDEAQVAAVADYLALNVRNFKAGALAMTSEAIRASQLPIGADIAAARAVGRGLTLGEGVGGIQRDLLSRVLSGNMVPRGYRGTLEQYAELLARTRSREAQVAGMLQRMADFGVDLVRVPPHGACCDFCDPLQGAVFSISGRDKRYPPLSLVGPPPWHPNCKDVLAPFVEDLASEKELSEARKAGAEALKSAEKAA